MNKILKIGVASLAISAVCPAFAQEEIEEEVESSVVGFTPIAVGIATPVQLPWGINRWDVFGLDFNLFYSDAPKMYGLDFGGLATLTRDDTIGLVAGGLANVSFADIYGLRATCGLNYTEKSVWGAEVGLIGFRENLVGFDANILGSFQQQVCGVQISGLANVAKVKSHGCNVAGIANLAEEAHGLQLAVVFNMTKELNGAQVGLINYTEDCPAGFQIGLVNIILQNKIKFLPFVNGYF